MHTKENCFATNYCFKKITSNQALEILKFKNERRTIYKTFISKLLLKSPLKYRLVKGLSCLNPEIALQAEIAEKHLSTVLEKFVDNDVLKADKANLIQRQCNYIIRLEATKEKLKSFKKSELRLDHFWVGTIEMYGLEKYAALFGMINTIMILSHGNASLERGFFINKECRPIVENQKEKSLIAQRLICDELNSMDCSLDKFEIDKHLG